jgi:dihydrofolate reductase
MAGGTTFHFVTDGIHAALSRAREAAQGKDVRVGGGVATVRQSLPAGWIRRAASGDPAGPAR